jgi:hypothetical protein
MENLEAHICSLKHLEGSPQGLNEALHTVHDEDKDGSALCEEEPGVFPDKPWREWPWQENGIYSSITYHNRNVDAFFLKGLCHQFRID